MRVETIGDATLYLGDCREIMPSLGRVDGCVTDPPYGIGQLMKGGANTGHWNHLSGGNQWDMIAPDVEPLLSCADKVVIWGGNYFPLPPSRCWFSWVKTNSVPTQADMEMAWTNLDAPARCFHAPTGGSYVREHPTQKPLELMRWCIDKLATSPYAKIIDPYMGSGTTGVAAINEGKRFIGIERAPEYFSIACRRIEEATRQPDMFIEKPRPMIQQSLL